MYITSPGKFPARALYTPPFRTRGKSGNRPFNRRCLYLLRQRVSTLSLYTPFFPLSNSVDIIFTEILFSKSPLSQYKVFKVQTGELSEFLLGRSGAVDKISLCSALPTKKDAHRRHPACFIIRFRFNAVADKRQWSSAASKPRRKTRAKLCSRFCAENEPSHQTCRSFSASP